MLRAAGALLGAALAAGAVRGACPAAGSGLLPADAVPLPFERKKVSPLCDEDALVERYLDTGRIVVTAACSPRVLREGAAGAREAWGQQSWSWDDTATGIEAGGRKGALGGPEFDEEEGGEAPGDSAAVGPGAEDLFGVHAGDEIAEWRDLRRGGNV